MIQRSGLLAAAVAVGIAAVAMTDAGVDALLADELAQADPAPQPLIPGQPPAAAEPPAVIPPAAAPPDMPAQTAIPAPTDQAPYIEAQGPSEFLATDLIGLAVQTPAGETIGDIADILFNEDQTPVGVVVEAGGFLGIGAKRVGIPIERFDFDVPSEVAVLDVSAEELEAAPEFMTMAQLEERMQEEAPAAP
jgi:hypothetical protein